MQSIKINFPNSAGNQLAGILDMPIGASLVFLRLGFHLDDFIDLPLLCDRQQRVRYPVENQARGEERKEAGEHDRHDLHDFCLHRVIHNANGAWRISTLSSSTQ